jgi:hypothetical protein
MPETSTVYRRRRLAALGVVAAAAALAGAATGAGSGGREAAVGADGAPKAAAVKAPPKPAELPLGGRTIFPRYRVVAFYGAPQSHELGALGIGSPDAAGRRLRRQARPYARKTRPVMLAFELIATVANADPGEDGLYRTRQSNAVVRRYLRAARRAKAMLLLDIQPGHADFLTAAKRWRWALRDPWVGLALDPEWRMSGHDVPGHVIGHVDAGEVNRTSAWLARLVERDHLPQKLFVLHQFRTGMIEHIERIKARPGLAMVQHVDGFGTPGEKRQTFHAVVRPGRFVLGFKLFYQVDVHRMSARQVFELRPRVRFVSFQ